MLQAYIVVFSSSDVSDPEAVLPYTDDINDSFREYLGLPDENVLVSVWPVELERLVIEGACRRCGQECEEGRLFCEPCSGKIVAGTCQEEPDE